MYLFGSEWSKFAEYEVVDDTYIVPKKGLKPFKYDPIRENELGRNRGKNTIWMDLSNILKDKGIKWTTIFNEDRLSKLEKDKDIQKGCINFANKWGLLGILPHKCDEIILPAMYLPVDAFNEFWEEIFNIEPVEISNDGDIKRYDYEIPKDWIVKNYNYKFELDEPIHSPQKKIIHNYWELNISDEDPTNLKWKEQFDKDSRHINQWKVLVPQQLHYKFINGTWRIESTFLNLIKIKEDAKPGDLIHPKFVTNQNDLKKINQNYPIRYSDPGYYYQTNLYDHDLKNYRFIDSRFQNRDKRIFVKFCIDKKIKKSNKKDEELNSFDTLELQNPKKYLEFFPRLTQNKNFIPEEFFWHKPGTDSFFMNYNEKIRDLIEYSRHILAITESLMLHKSWPSKLDREKFFQFEDSKSGHLNKLTEKVMPTTRLMDGENEKLNFKVHFDAPSLLSYLGMAMIIDFSNEYPPFECKRCGQLWPISSRSSQKWCPTGCKEKHHSKSSMAKKRTREKICKDWENKRIDNKEAKKLIKRMGKYNPIKKDILFDNLGI